MGGDEINTTELYDHLRERDWKKKKKTENEREKGRGKGGKINYAY